MHSCEELRSPEELAVCMACLQAQVRQTCKDLRVKVAGLEEEFKASSKLFLFRRCPSRERSTDGRQVPGPRSGLVGSFSRHARFSSLFA